MYAIRNIHLCNKDFLCLYTCPTGATNTETGQIDKQKCIACGMCIKTCPSHAISFMPRNFPAQQPKTPQVLNNIKTLTTSQCQQQNIAHAIKQKNPNTDLAYLASAIEKSKRIIAQDMARESGYMLPQSANTHHFLRSLKQNNLPEDFPHHIVEKLLTLLQSNQTI